MRVTVLEKIKDVIDGLEDPYGRFITAENRNLDPFTVPPEDLPIFGVTAAPHTIEVGLYGSTRDNNFVVSLVGYTRAAEQETIFITAENIIDTVVDALLSTTNAAAFIALLFSIVNIGPIFADQFDDDGEMAYITIPLQVQFIDDDV